MEQPLSSPPPPELKREEEVGESHELFGGEGRSE